MRLPGFFVFMGPPVRLFRRTQAARLQSAESRRFERSSSRSASNAGVIPAAGTPNGYAQERMGYALGNRDKPSATGQQGHRRTNSGADRGCSEGGITVLSQSSSADFYLQFHPQFALHDAKKRPSLPDRRAPQTIRIHEKTAEPIRLCGFFVW